MMDRRSFIKRGSLVSLGFIGLRNYIVADPEKLLADKSVFAGYGPLQDDPLRLLNLPSRFHYKIISKKGDQMSDGLLVPGLGDGMATFKHKNDRIFIIRNHEISPIGYDNSGFGVDYGLIDKIDPKGFYDFGRGKRPCLGGTTTMIYNEKSGKVEHQWLSLAGTVRNCAGGPTPWNSWISCEESVIKANDILEKDHGYNFEVPAAATIKVTHPFPLLQMGRFNHEAVCVDPRTSIVYQTEDRPDGLIYRYLPNQPKKLAKGGKLQVMALKQQASFDTRNWDETLDYHMEIGQEYEVYWLDIDHVKSPEDDLRYRGAEAGAATFARGEGMWFGKNECYFACTNGGRKGRGQIFKYTPSPYEGTREEAKSPGILELFIEPNDSQLIESCDNLTIAANGDLIVCEDKSRPRIVGVTPQGRIYHFGLNVGYPSEFAGATFSPDGKTLFVNIQGPGLTLAIKGPWQNT